MARSQDLATEPAAPPGRRRPTRILLALAAVLVLAAVGVFVATRGGDEAAGPPATTTTLVDAEVTVTGTEIFSPGGGVTGLDPAIQDQIAASIRTFLARAPQQPPEASHDKDTTTTLAAPRPTGIEELMTERAAARLAGPDRAALVDEGLPAPIEKVTTRRANVGLGVLAGDDAAPQVVTADLDTESLVTLRGDRLTVVRTGQLVFVPVDGTWKIAGYRLTVQRTLGSESTSTSEAAFG